MFNFEIKDIVDNKIVVLENKVLYNLDKQKKLSDWLREGTRGGSSKPVPTSTNGFNAGNKLKPLRGDALGVLISDSNSIGVSSTGVFLTNTRGNSNAGSVQILPSNFSRCCVGFSARKLSTKSVSWVNEKDPYLKPNEEHESFSEFSYDSLVYSLFHSSSNQCSLKEFGFEENRMLMLNHFFFMPREEMLEIADKNGNIELYNTARYDEDRFTSKVINLVERTYGFSDEATKVLVLARQLTRDSVIFRKEFNLLKPEYQINNWDCGWYQIKGLLNWIVENNKDAEIAEKYLEFKEAYKTLGDKMRPMVYELGFLKK